MNIADKARIIYQVIHWRLTWNKRDTSYVPPRANPEKFISALDAAALIEDGATVVSSGMAGNARCSIFFWGIKERFQAEQHPRNLTWISVGAQGSRGRAPGTMEEMDFPGLMTRFIGGHVETSKAQLKLADAGHLEIHTLPQGEMSLLLESQGEGVYELESTTGVGTFLDPRVGSGSPVTPTSTMQLVEARGDKLAYHLPKVEVALFSCPYADSEGNLYFKHASTITENVQTAKAAHHNGGLVMAAVCDIIPKNEAEISLEAKYVDKIVVNPRNEQTGSVSQRKYWPMLAVGGNVDTQRAVDMLKFANGILKITPLRGPVENALARLASSLFTQAAKRGDIINIGVGLPEEVCRLLYESGLYTDLKFTSETGVFGGLPTPGIFFGAAINPERIEPSSWMFKLYREKLSIAVLGYLQVDSEGNVNVSKRGPRMLDYVGPGGFPNIVEGAKTIIFTGKWMDGAKMSLSDGQLVIDQPGKCKFIEKVDQITFSGKEALKAGKQVYYVSNVGVFKLTEQGLLLIKVMPGVDIEKDIIAVSKATILLPEDGQVDVVERSIVTGENFKLSWPD